MDSYSSTLKAEVIKLLRLEFNSIENLRNIEDKEAQNKISNYFFSSITRSCDDEFEMYLLEREILKNACPDKWWAKQVSRMPKMVSLARKYSTQSERVFSTAGNILSAKRNCLSAENVNRLVFLHQNKEML